MNCFMKLFFKLFHETLQSRAIKPSRVGFAGMRWGGASTGEGDVAKMSSTLSQKDGMSPETNYSNPTSTKQDGVNLLDIVSTCCEYFS